LAATLITGRGKRLYQHDHAASMNDGRGFEYEPHDMPQIADELRAYFF